MTKLNFSEMSTADLRSWYNAHASKPVARFSDRAAAIRRCEALAEMAPGKACPACGQVQDQAPAGEEGTRAGERLFCHHCGATYEPSGRIYHAPASNPSRSAAIASSWTNPEVRAARSQRTSVRCGGTVYPSLARAFRALGLPLARHIAYRIELKATGRITVGSHVFTVEETK